MRVTLSKRKARLTGWIALLLTVAMCMIYLRAQRFVSFGKLGRTPLSSTSFARASHVSTAVTTDTRHRFTNSINPTSTKMSNIVHVVLLQFKPEVSPERVLDVHWPFYWLSRGALISLIRIYRYANKCSRLRIGACLPPRTNRM